MIHSILQSQPGIQPHWDGMPAWDAFTPCGTPALACFDGYATPNDYPLGGHTVFLVGDDGMQAYYAHLMAGGRSSGRVVAGQVIGYVSNTGNANKRGDGQCHDDESHIHFAVGVINSNGSGTIDPAEFFSSSQPDQVQPGGGSTGEPFPLAAGPAWRDWAPSVTKADARHALDTIYGYATLVGTSKRLTRKLRNQMANELKDNVIVLKAVANLG